MPGDWQSTIGKYYTRHKSQARRSLLLDHNKKNPSPATRHTENRYTRRHPGMRTLICALLVCLYPFQVMAGQPLDNKATNNEPGRSPGAIPGAFGPGTWGRARLPAIAAGYPFRRLPGQLSGTPGGSTYRPASRNNPLQQLQAGSRHRGVERAAGISITLSW